MYIYPDNLKSKATLWLWELRDIGFIGIGCLISVFALAQLGWLPPIVVTAVYAFYPSVLRIPVSSTSSDTPSCFLWVNSNSMSGGSVTLYPFHDHNHCGICSAAHAAVNSAERKINL
jgi:hypothetical protein